VNSSEELHRPTILDVATRAGVSKSVVSRVLTGAPGVAESTRERVRAAAEALGYVPNVMAQSMVARRTHTLGVFVRDVATSFYGHLLTAMQEQAAARSYRVVTATGSGRFAVQDERRALETLVGLRVEGLIVCSGLLPVQDIVPLARRIPTVVAGRPETSPEISSVFCDEIGGGRGLADHVWDLGHRRVAVATMSLAQSKTIGARGRAMVDRLRALGAEVREVPLPRDLSDCAKDWDDLVHRVMDGSGVSALMMGSDRHALGVLEALQRRGLQAPADLSVTGYDGVAPLDTPVIGLATWVQPLTAIGRAAVDLVVDQVESQRNGIEPITGHRSLAGGLRPGRTLAPVVDRDGRMP